MLDCPTCVHRIHRALFAHSLSVGFIGRNTAGTTAKKSTRSPAIWSRRTSTAVATPLKENRSSKQQFDIKKPAEGGNLRNVTSDPSQYALEKEMRFLQDPLKLADNTVKLLKNEQAEKAGQLVRMASRKMACTVSWNHMIDYEMSKGRTSRAMTVYNDMKKRGQKPDAHTYTILLRGLAWHSDYGKSLERALTVYHSMFAPNSPVRPTIIHTNATLKVCARAGDLDALWGVAARLPSSGPRAPDKTTFTTIFNAVRYILTQDDRRVDDQTPQEIPQENIDRRQKAVLQGRRMWAEIIDRWKAGDIALDEELVCAVGRLLLLAEVPQDLDDVLSLLEQTMGIPRQKPSQRKSLHAMDSTPLFSAQEAYNAPSQKASIEGSDKAKWKPFGTVDEDFVPGDEFLPVPSTNLKSYARPSHNALSLILDTCTRLRAISTAQDYWGLLTSSPYNITPDTENYHMYLRLLRLQRASRQCVELIQEMREGLGVGAPIPEAERRGIKGEAGGVQAKTFKIALGACKRDINNPNVVTNAAKLVRMMIDCLPQADLSVLRMYVEVSLGAASHDWRKMSAALRGTELGVRQLRSMLNFDGWEVTPAGQATSKDYDKIREIHSFLNMLIGAYDQLVNAHGDQMLAEERRRCVKQRAIIAAWQTRVSRKLGTVKGSRRHWGKERQAEGNVPEHGNPNNTRHLKKEVRLGERVLSPLSEGGQQEGTSDWEDGQAREDPEPLWLREARIARRKAEAYTHGGANKRKAMAQYLRRMENASLQ